MTWPDAFALVGSLAVIFGALVAILWIASRE